MFGRTASGPFAELFIIRTSRVRFYTSDPTLLSAKNSPRIFVVVIEWVSKHKDFRFSLLLARRKVLVCQPQHRFSRTIISFERLGNQSRYNCFYASHSA